MIVRTPELTSVGGAWVAGGATWLCRGFVEYRWAVPAGATIVIKISSRNHRGAWPVDLRHVEYTGYTIWRTPDRMAPPHVDVSRQMLRALDDFLSWSLPISADWSRWYVSVEYTENRT